MNILISLPTPREFKNILSTPLLDLIKNDENQYLIVTHSTELRGIIENQSSNIKCITYQKPNSVQLLIHRFFLDRLYEILSLKLNKSVDGFIFYNRLKKHNRKKYVLGMLAYGLYKIVGVRNFRSIEN